jgi:hypothetical protein
MKLSKINAFSAHLYKKDLHCLQVNPARAQLQNYTWPLVVLLSTPKNVNILMLNKNPKTPKATFSKCFSVVV